MAARITWRQTAWHRHVDMGAVLVYERQGTTIEATGTVVLIFKQAVRILHLSSGTSV